MNEELEAKIRLYAERLKDESYDWHMTNDANFGALLGGNMVFDKAYDMLYELFPNIVPKRIMCLCNYKEAEKHIER